jgi:hypothetical protein
MLPTKTPNLDDSPIPHNIKEINNLIASTRNDYIQQRDRTLREENETERVACSQLILASTVLISGTVLLISSNTFLANVTIIGKILLLVGMIFFTCSILSGIKYNFVIVDFHMKWALALNNIVDIFGKANYRNYLKAGEETNGIQASLPISTNKSWLYIQIGLLVAGITAYFSLLITFIFK